MLFSAFSDVGGVVCVFLFFCICASIRADILTKTPPALFGIFSVFFDTVDKIFIYFNNIFYIDKNGRRAFLLFGLFRFGG